MKNYLKMLKLITIINNMGAVTPSNKFYLTFNEAVKSIKDPRFQSVIIVDDSGYDRFDDSKSNSYYQRALLYKGVSLLRNNPNLNLLAARFSALDTLNGYNRNETWVRYLDAGDLPVNTEQMYTYIQTLVKDQNPDLINYNQWGYDGKEIVYNVYPNLIGDCTDKSKLIVAGLTNTLVSTMWTKVFKLGTLLDVRKAIMRNFNGKIPRIFDLEDYLITNLAILEINKLSSLEDVYIAYDYTSGESNSKELSREDYNMKVRYCDIVKSILLARYLRVTAISEKFLTQLIDYRINNYLSKYKVV